MTNKKPKGYLGKQPFCVQSKPNKRLNAWYRKGNVNRPKQQKEQSA